MNKGITESIELKVQGKETLEIRLTADNYLVDWGDGIHSKDNFHSYILPKEKHVTITGEKIYALSVKGKGVISIRTCHCYALHHITCSDCNICDMELDCANLRGLSIQNNNLEQIVFNSTSLGWLICDCNNLHELDLSQQNRLIYLSCKFNHIKTLRLSESNKILKYLYCSGNNLSKEELQKIISYLPKNPTRAGLILDCNLNPGVRDCDFSVLKDIGWELRE